MFYLLPNVINDIDLLNVQGIYSLVPCSINMTFLVLVERRQEDRKPFLAWPFHSTPLRLYMKSSIYPPVIDVSPHAATVTQVKINTPTTQEHEDQWMFLSPWFNTTPFSPHQYHRIEHVPPAELLVTPPWLHQAPSTIPPFLA